MGWGITQNEEGKWAWYCFLSSYGYASGQEETLEAAKVELAIAEAAILEEPYPRTVVETMRSDYAKFAKDWGEIPKPNQDNLSL